MNARHKNGVAERSISTVSECARSLIIQSNTCWKSGIDYTICPLSVHYAAYMYNHMLSASNVSPVDVFYGTIFPHHKIRTFHVWQCPEYVLDPKYKTVKIFPAGNQIKGMAYFLGIAIIIPVTSLWSLTLPQVVFTLSIPWFSITPSAPFSISLIMKNPQYYGTTFTLTF